MDIHAKAYELMGTCDTFDTSDLTLAECHELDDIVMLCETCGWWCESDDIDDDGNCSECREGN